MDRRQFFRIVGAAGLGGLGSVAGCVSGRDGVTDDTDRDPAGNGSDREPSGSEGADGGPGSEGSVEGNEDGTDGAADGAAWPSFGADPGNTGVRPDAAGPSSGTVAWRGIGDAPTVLCSPTVADGTVYTGSAANAVHAFDAATGEERWTYGTGSYVETAPVVAGGAVYAADADGVVYSLTTGGEERWTHETGRNLHSRGIAVRDGTVVVGTAGTMPAVVSGDTDASKAGSVVALDAGSGEPRWTYEGPPDWFTGPAVGGGRVYVGNHAGQVAALDPATGEAVWSRDLSNGDDRGGILAPPTYRDGRLYVGVHGRGVAVALDAATGETRWSQSLRAPNVKSSPAVDGEYVYLGATGSESSDYDAPGEETPTPTTTDDGPSMPTVRISGSVFALSAADGSIEWRYETDHDFRSSPAVVGETVYVGGGDGLLALSRTDGAERWRVGFGDFVYSSPAVVDGRAYVGSADGYLYCVGEDGA